MSDQDALTPRVILVRHGETEWAKSGRYTGTTDIDLTPEGAAHISSMAPTFVGECKLIDPSQLAHIFVSPRKRARRTFELLLPLSFRRTAEAGKTVTYTEDIAEWDYGEYEGLHREEIIQLRTERGLDYEREWNIWRDGCEGGESMEQVSDRLNRLISQIREIHRPYMNGGNPANVLIVAHGLILRCFSKRWLGLSVDDALDTIMDPTAIGILSYKNNDIQKPALHIGVALPQRECTNTQGVQDQSA